MSEAVLFPMTAAQARGLEDLRLVQFTQDDGAQCYHGTFTAFDGVTGRAQMLSTHDFRRFDIRTHRAGGGEQGHGPVSAQSGRPLRHDRTAGQREPLAHAV
ncbi:hypothetical protein ACFS32_11950 [Novosphingobium pokkalii]|uniref:hypothetical protein n=1 Tax=Novosphingobium pokkalii TaxID=1770194 RepID=UPI00364422FA